MGGQTFVNNAADVQDLVIPVGSKDPAKATSDVLFASNLDKRTPEIPAGATAQTIQEGTWQTTFDIYDSFGRRAQAAGQLHQGARRGQQVAGGSAVSTRPPGRATNTRVQIGNGQAAATPSAGLRQPRRACRRAGRRGDHHQRRRAAGAGLLRRSGHDSPAGGGHGAPDLQSQPRQRGGLPGRHHAVRGRKLHEGRPAGRVRHGLPGDLQDRPVGIITGVYTNGSNRSIGQIALASFTNPGGLEKDGENTY